MTGIIDMVVDQFDPGAFGLASSPGSLQAVFSASLKGWSPVGSPPPDDGIYGATLEDFELVIGNTSWDETMPYNTDEFVIEIVSGVAIGTNMTITKTTPHPDLIFSLPTSPGTWQADDVVIVGGVETNNGSISGTYTLRAIPEPSLLALLGIGVAGFGIARYRGKLP